MGRKGKKRRIDELGWKKVEFNAEHFLKMGEGFEGLSAFEEIDAKAFYSKPKSKAQPSSLPSEAVAGAPAAATEKGRAKKRRKKDRKEEKSVGKTTARVPEDDESLFAIFDQNPIGNLPKNAHIKKKRMGGKSLGSPDTKAEKTTKKKSKTNRKTSPRDNPKLVDGKKWKELKLHDEVVMGVRAMGFANPTAVQTRCIPLAGAEGKDIIAAAATGSGKTLAFCLPIIHRLLIASQTPPNLQPPATATNDNGVKNYKKTLQALILTPTRDLANQIKQELETAAKFTTIRAALVIGGMSEQKQERILRKGPEVVIGTPGRLWEMIESGNEHLSELKNLRFLVLDEADRMLERGHFAELTKIVDAIVKQTAIEPSTRQARKKKRTSKVQTMLFSATMTLDGSGRDTGRRRRRPKTNETTQQMLAQLEKRLPFRRSPVLIDLSEEEGSRRGLSAGVSNYIAECVDADKDVYLYYFLHLYKGKTIIFVNTIACLRRVNAILQILDKKAHPIHAQMQQRQRLKNIDRFRSSKNGILLASDVAARGIDFDDIAYIVNYQLPPSAEIFIHRCGRTARAGRKGMSFSLVGPKDRRSYQRICSALGEKGGLEELEVEEGMLNGVKRRVSLGLRIDKVLSKKGKVKANNDWYRKNANLMGIDVPEDLLVEEDEDDRWVVREKAELKRMQNELKLMLKQPLVARGVSRKFLSLNSVRFDKNGKIDIESIRRRG